MGLFFGNTGSKKIFQTKEKVRLALQKIGSLTKDERELIYDRIEPELDDGGVTEYEGKKKLNSIFYALAREGKISQVDYEDLKKLWQ